MSKRDLARALQAVSDHQQLLLEKWTEIHG